MGKDRNPLGATPEEFSAHCRQMDADSGPVCKWRVTVGASNVGSLGAGYDIKRSYEIAARRVDLFAAAINRAYEDGDIEHVRVESFKIIPE